VVKDPFKERTPEMRQVLMQVPAGRHYTEVADPDADVHEAAVINIEAARVRRQIRRLPTIERRVIRWRYGIECDKLTVREIAARMGIGKSTVSDIEARALDRLRAQLGFMSELREAA
jgi:RNA polymerase sigma factor (sigma-70 family)